MLNPLAAELIRQVLRWIGVWLLATNTVPTEVAGMLHDPDTVAFVTGAVSYALAELGWLASKRKPKDVG